MSTAVAPLVAQPLSGDLQPLFQQLVFECKVHAALHGAAFAAIAHAFHRWLHCDPIRLPLKALANQPPPQRVRAAVDTSPLTDSSPPKATGGASTLSASNELATFRIAREELRREAAAAAEARETSAASMGVADAEVATPPKASSSGGDELASARRRVSAWQAALRHVVASLETEVGRRRHEAAPPATDDLARRQLLGLKEIGLNPMSIYDF